jgi:Uma2 family endonuclease
LLLNGDHLTVPEFERRYEAMPHECKAELIEGIVVMAPPVSSDHGESHIGLGYLLRFYALHTEGVAAGVCASFRVDGMNEYQPDIFLRINDPAKGRSKIGAGHLLDGAPELVAEIAVSSAGYDLHEKKQVYERCGAPEYLVWQVREEQFHWFVLEKGAYTKLQAEAGVLKSRIFPGLWIDAQALLTGDDFKALRVLERGLKSAGHKTFVKNLKKSA